VSLAALEQVLDAHRVSACWFMTSFQNPLGATMPDEKKRDLMRLLDSRGVPLIEDDAYAELYFATARPRPAKAFDGGRIVLHCGSFSKCLAPGYRLGWVAAGRFAREVERRKVMTSISTSLPVQEGIADVLRRGGYDAHLTKLRRALATQQTALLGSLQRHWRGAYRVTRPDVWLELPRTIDGLELHRRALDHGISIAPGPIFSPRREYRNCIRLNCGHPWTPELDAAVARLAKLAAALGG
jgi:DNA-binding transcriptional MocR family regulator